MSPIRSHFCILAALAFGLVAPCVSGGEVGPVSRQAAEKTDPVLLKAYEVALSAFSDFGMSLRTNFEVKWGGVVEWMQVSRIDPGSSASRAGIVAGDRILAIDGQLIGTMDRDQMLDKFFYRKRGERSKLLILGRKESLPHFVTLVASRPQTKP